MELRILLVDDSQMTLHLVRAHLVGENHHYTETRSGAEALGRLQKEPFDLVLSDVFMPGMDGWEFTRAVRCLASEVRTIPIVLASSRRSSDVRMRSLAAGATSFLFKPFVAAELAAALQRASTAGRGSEPRVSAAEKKWR